MRKTNENIIGIAQGKGFAEQLKASQSIQTFMDLNMPELKE